MASKPSHGPSPCRFLHNGHEVFLTESFNIVHLCRCNVFHQVHQSTQSSIESHVLKLNAQEKWNTRVKKEMNDWLAIYRRQNVSVGRLVKALKGLQTPPRSSIVLWYPMVLYRTWTSTHRSVQIIQSKHSNRERCMLTFIHAQ